MLSQPLEASAFRRAVAGLVAAALILVSPGLEPYRAFAEAVGGAAAGSSGATPVGLAGSSLPVTLPVQLQGSSRPSSDASLKTHLLSLEAPSGLGQPPSESVPTLLKASPPEADASAGSAASPDTRETLPSESAPRQAAGAEEGARQEPGWADRMASDVGKETDALAKPQATPETASRIGQDVQNLVEGRVRLGKGTSPEVYVGRRSGTPSRWKNIVLASALVGAVILGPRFGLPDSDLAYTHAYVGHGYPAVVPIHAPAPQLPPVQMPVPAIPPDSSGSQQHPPSAAPDASQQSSPAAAQALSVEVRIEAPAKLTVGDPFSLVVTVRNTSSKPIQTGSVRAALEEVLPDALEILKGPERDAPIIGAGESATFRYELAAFDSGAHKIEKAVLLYPVETDSGMVEVKLEVPVIEVQVASVLTPDWKEKGFRGIFSVEKRDTLSLGWLAVLPLAILLFIALERVIAARRRVAALSARRAALMEWVAERIGSLEKQLAQNRQDASAARAFYLDLADAISRFFVDWNGLPVKERTFEELLGDIEASHTLVRSRVSEVEQVLRRASDVAYARGKTSPDQMRSDLEVLKGLVGAPTDNLDGRTPWGSQTGSAHLGLVATLGGFTAGLPALPEAAQLQWGNPWALLAFIPFVLFLVWKYFFVSKPRYSVPTVDTLGKKKSLRQRLLFLPKWLRIAAIALILTAAAQPQLGLRHQETYVPSTDTVISFDISGSMTEAFNSGGGSKVTKLDGAKEATKYYINEQRKGTTNRVALISFADLPYLNIRLTTDYDGLITALKEMEGSGSTAVGAAIIRSISHFMEMNALELNPEGDVQVQTLRKILLEQGLPAALEYAKTDPELLNKVLRPDRTKIVISFSDFDSNTSIPPLEAAAVAKKLGIRVYTIGTIAKGSTSSFNPETWKQVAEITGGKFGLADDPDKLMEIMREISRLEKSPSLVRSVPSTHDLSIYLVLLALAALGFEIVLSNTRLRTFPAYLLLLGLPLSQMADLPSAQASQLAAAAKPPAMVLMQAQPQAPPAQQQGDSTRPRWLPKGDPQWGSLVKGVPPELEEGNKLYVQGNHREALAKYTQAAARYPEIKETYFNMGNAYLRLGQLEQAEASFRRYMALFENEPPSPERDRQISKAYHNIAHAVLAQGDAQFAIDMFRAALKVLPPNAQTKWDLEVTMRMLEEQKEQDSEKQDKQKKSRSQRGKKDQKGKPGQQQAQQGQQQGQQGDPNQQQQASQQQGDQKAGGDGKEGKEGPSGVDQLIKKQGQVDKETGTQIDRGLSRKGWRNWSFFPPIFMLNGQGTGLPDLSSMGFGDMGVGFSHPFLLYLIPVALAVAAGYAIWGLYKRLQAARKLAPAKAPERFVAWGGKNRFLAKLGMLLAAFGLVSAAATGPFMGMREERVGFGGADVKVAVDLSHSVYYAEDKRFSHIQSELDQFVQKLQGTDRVGLLVFAGTARTASPISMDYGNFQYKVQNLKYERIGLSEGSKLGQAVQKAVSAFGNVKKVGDRPRVLILLSDGDLQGENTGELNSAIEAAKKNNVVIYVIGVGTPEGSKMLVPKEYANGVASTELVELVDNESGKVALTRLNEEPLRLLAEATGGAYFRSQDGKGIQETLSKMAVLQKKKQNDDVIQAPAGAAHWLLAPAAALLLLDFLLPGLSALSRRKQKVPPPPRKSERGSAHLGLLTSLAFPSSIALGGAKTAPIPLSVWPQLLPFAILIMFLVAALTVDVLSRGAISKRIKWALARWTGAVSKGIEEDLGLLFDLREIDEARLSEFLETWKKAAPAQKAALIQGAGADEQLWREKLILAYLYETDFGLQEAVLRGLAARAARSPESLSPIVEHLKAAAQSLDWMDDPKITRDLSHLSGEDAAVTKPQASTAQPGAARPGTPSYDHPSGAPFHGSPYPLRPPMWKQALKRLGTAAMVLFLAVSIGFTTMTGIKTQEYHQKQYQAMETAKVIFFGEDLFIFSDRYSDERIPKKVLPLLSGWHEDARTAAPEWLKAVQILRASTDPKADNVLEVLFKKMELLPLDQKAATELLSALMERDNDAIWRFLEDQMVQRPQDPKTTQKMLLMIELASETGSERVFSNLFHFLKHPNPQVRSEAGKAILTSLNAPDKKPQALNRLEAVQGRYAQDPAVQVWIEFFLIRQAASQEGSSPVWQVKRVQDAILRVDDSLRDARVKATAGLKAGEELPPPYLTQVLSAAEAGLKQVQAQSPSASGGQEAVQHLFNQTTLKLIKEGEARFQGLHESLQSSGVNKQKRGTEYSYGSGGEDYDDYEDGHGYGRYGRHGYNGGGYSGSSSNSGDYRDAFKLWHLDKLQEQLERAAQNARGMSGPEKAPGPAGPGDASRAGKLTPDQQEYLDRAGAVLEKLREFGPAAGIQEGDPSELSAETVTGILTDGAFHLGASFTKLLKEKGLAKHGHLEYVTNYHESYTREQIRELKTLFQELKTSGQGWNYDGTRRTFYESEKGYVEKALEALDRVEKQFFPGPPAPAQPKKLSLYLSAGLLGLRIPRLRRKGARAGFASSSAIEEDPGEASPEVLARHKKIEIAALKLANSMAGGTFRSYFIGQGGTDFAESAKYQGEDQRFIDWRTSAKRGELYVKKFELEKEMPLILFVDVSRSSHFGTQDTDKRTAIRDVASVLALAAAHKNVRVGVVFFTDRIEQVILPKGGPRHAWEIIYRMAGFKPKGTRTDLNLALKEFVSRFQGRAMGLVVSDFVASDFSQALREAAGRHDLVPIVVQDPAETQPLPDVGLLEVADSETGEPRVVDTSNPRVRQEHAAALLRRQSQLQSAFQGAGVRPIPLSTAEDYLETLWIQLKARKRGPLGGAGLR